MLPLTQLEGTDIWVIEVEQDIQPTITILNSPSKEVGYFLQYLTNDFNKKYVVLKNKHEFIGIVTESKIGFNATDYVENNGMHCYINYTGTIDNKFTFLTPADSFRSLLLLNGIYYTNKCKPEYLGNPDFDELVDEYLSIFKARELAEQKK